MGAISKNNVAVSVTVGFLLNNDGKKSLKNNKNTAMTAPDNRQNLEHKRKAECILSALAADKFCPINGPITAESA